jgi:8-oxo-dGTP pyrophosphatase MutT (NUDIX family)
MKRRDDLPWLIFPDQWSLFGGGIEPGETPEEALRRELREELAYEAEAPEFFTEWRVMLPFPVPHIVEITYYVVGIKESDIQNLTLMEGAEMALFRPEELAILPNVIPVALALVLMHARRELLFRPPAAQPPN